LILGQIVVSGILHIVVEVVRNAIVDIPVLHANCRPRGVVFVIGAGILGNQ
jgi:hypothetical protein